MLCCEIAFGLLLLWMSASVTANSLQQCNGVGTIEVRPGEPSNITCEITNTTQSVTWTFLSLLDAQTTVIAHNCDLVSRNPNTMDCQSKVPYFTFQRPHYDYTSLEVVWSELPDDKRYGIIQCSLDGKPPNECYLSMNYSSPKPPHIKCTNHTISTSLYANPDSWPLVTNNTQLRIGDKQIYHCLCSSQIKGHPEANFTWSVNDQPEKDGILKITVDEDPLGAEVETVFECNMKWNDREEVTVVSVRHLTEIEGRRISYDIIDIEREEGTAANVTSFSADGHSGSRKVQQGTSVILDCQATGTPEPNVSIVDNGGVVMEPQLNNLTLDFNVTGKCDTAHSLACRADNGVQSSEKTIVLFVECDTDSRMTPYLYTIGGGVLGTIVLVVVSVTIICLRRKGKPNRESQSREIRTNQPTSQRRTVSTITSCSNNTEPQHSHIHTPRDVTPPTRHVTFPANPVHGPISSTSTPFIQIVIPNDRLGIQIVSEPTVLRSRPELRDDARPGVTEPRLYDNASHLGSQRTLHYDGTRSRSFETSQNLTVANNSEFIPSPDYLQDTPEEEDEPGGERDQ